MSESLLIATVCDVTGASPNGSSGILLLNKRLISTNIVSENRRELVINDAKKLFKEKIFWTETTYPLGDILSNSNGNFRVVYQYLDSSANHAWIKQAQSLVRRESNAWLIFRKGAINSNSTITALPNKGSATLSRQLRSLLDIPASTPLNRAVGVSHTEAKVLTIASNNVLLLPVRAPPNPISVVGRHRVAIEVVRILGLLPLPVNWIAEEFYDTDPSGPLVYRQAVKELSNELPAIGSVVIIMTNNHQLDLELCKQLLKQPQLTFVGCIGSTKKAALFRQQLLLFGIGQVQMDKLYMPVGLPEITGKHPSLIAASAVAQLLTIHKPPYDDFLTDTAY